MIELALIGIGTGNPDHVTAQAIEAMNAADLIMIPVKGPEKTELAELRRTLLTTYLKNPETRVVEFDLPVRDAVTTSYGATVADWHGAIAEAWETVISDTLDPGTPGRVALLIWGDPMLYDSSLRIAVILGRRIPLRPRVIPGITAIQALCAAHAIPLNEVGAPVVISTGRQLRDHGWPDGAETVVVMLDGECSFRTLEPEGIHIWWGGCVSMPQERLVAGALSDVGAKIVAVREELRARNGWVMDIYLLRRMSRKP
ncbi:precorrin-6A synthase (deacetylating) [Thioclava nitratireducens]|uniref:precorrin-6A synthase (deacetylating) n=1 Tax=Thioclava nitratireducens TaxID=1915078 RepID=UPI00248001D9|nr:precorrin-6A synthase (deacetylating) [Thioclava nitratireducens]WGT51399.1 precorrin-6A synthase (deacetylating) [Thioclava nitratireducens]